MGEPYVEPYSEASSPGPSVQTRPPSPSASRSVSPLPASAVEAQPAPLASPGVPSPARPALTASSDISEPALETALSVTAPDATQGQQSPQPIFTSAVDSRHSSVDDDGVDTISLDAEEDDLVELPPFRATQDSFGYFDEDSDPLVEQGLREGADAEPEGDEPAGIPRIVTDFVESHSHSLPSLRTGVSWVQWRYGFTTPRNSVGQVPRPKGVDWNQALNAGAYEAVPDELISHLRLFTAALTANPPRHQQLTPYLDILSGNPAYLDPAQSCLGVERMVLSRVEKGLETRRIVYRLLPEQESSEPHYPWIFAVDDASLVVLAIRSGCGHTRDALTRFFFDNGLPFHTLAIKHTNPVAKLVKMPSLSTLLTEFDEHDPLGTYMRYERVREDFFSSARGKAMVRYGGVVRRLYRLDPAETQTRLDHIIAGPTELAFFMGDAYSWAFRGHTLTLCEDTLTEGELHFVCGTYALPGSEFLISLFS